MQLKMSMLESRGRVANGTPILGANGHRTVRFSGALDCRICAGSLDSNLRREFMPEQA